MEENFENLKIMVIDDSKTIRRTAETLLKKVGCTVITATDGFDALAKIADSHPDIIFVDIMMPRLDGYQTCALIKNNKNFQDTPVIMLSSKDGLFDRAKGRIVGSDEYLTKPFSFNELFARIKAVLRRSDPKIVSDNLEFEDLKLDRNEKRVFRNEKEIKLGPTEFRLLEFFLMNPKRVYSRDQILENVWPNNVNVESRTIDVHIRRLRQSINLDGKKELIRTVRSSGYSLI